MKKQASKAGGRRTGKAPRALQREVAEERIQAALKASEREYRDLFESIHDAILIFRPEDEVVLEVNQRACELYGFDRSEFIGMSLEAITKDVPRGKKEIQLVMDQGFHQHYESVHYRKDGSEMHVEINASVVNYQGRWAIQSIHRDVTLRQRTLLALKASEEAFRLAFEGAQDALLWADPQTGLITNCNKAALDLLEKPKEEIIGQHQTTLHPPQKASLYVQIFERHIRETGVAEEEAEVITKSGKVKAVHITASVTMVGGKPIIQGIFRDVTERKRAEMALAQSETRLAMVVEASLDAILAVDERSHIVLFNAAAEELFGYSAREVIDAPMSILLSESAALLHQERVEKFMGRGVGQCGHIGRRVEKVFRRKNGTTFVAEVAMTGGRSNAKRLMVASIHDITERKRAAEALKESEEKYRLLVENSKQGILVLQDGLLKFVNPRAIEYSGYTQEELTSTPFPDLVHPEDRGMVAERYQRRLRGEDIPNGYQFRFINKQGQAQWVEVHSVLITWEGKPAALSFLSDIHERWLAEEALRESEEKYRLVVEHSSDAILVAQDGMMKFLNHRVKELTGYSERELTSRPFLEFIHPEDRQMVAVRHQSRLQGKAVPPVYPFRIVTKAREERWVEIHAITIPWQGKPATLNFLTDITERRRAEEALRESEALNRAVIEHSPVGISVRTRDGALLQVNEAWKKIWAMTDAEIQAAEQASAGRSFEERFPYLGEAAQDVRRIFSSEVETCHGMSLPSILFLPELEVKGPGDPRPGAARWISLYLYALRDEREGQVERVITLTQNITLRKELEEQFLQAQKLEAVGRLAGGVAHDFNNLLTGIMGYSDILCQKLKGPGGDQALLRYAEVILSSANRASNLTQQLLSLSRRHVAQPQVLDLSAAVRDTNKMLRRLIGEDIEFVARLDPSLGRVMLDPVQLEQVVMNLAVNARDAMPQGGRLTIRTADVVLDEAYTRRYLEVAPGPYLMLSLSDTGHGMGKEIQAHLFEPFFTTKEKGKGTGLGLSTVYGIVKQNGGHIEVESAPGEGATFKLYFPRVAEPNLTPSLPLSESVRRGGRGERLDFPRGTETILVAEDDEEVRAFACLVLRSAGYAVLEAGDGEEAFKMAGKHPGVIHLLVSDVIMPRLSGPGLAARLLPLRPEMKVLYMSGYTDGEVASAGPGGGLDANLPLLQKPFQGEVLLARVREVLGA